GNGPTPPIQSILPTTITISAPGAHPPQPQQQAPATAPSPQAPANQHHRPPSQSNASPPSYNGGNNYGRGGYSSGRGGYYNNDGNGRGGYHNNDRGGGTWRDPASKKYDYNNSTNPYIMGTAKWTASTDGPLCVDCGTLGHIATSCMGNKLSSWERDALRSIVFKNRDYVSAKSTRLFNAGLPINETELREEIKEMYASLGFTSDGHYRPPTKAEEIIPTITGRSAKLVLGDATRQGYVTEVNTRSGKLGAPYDIGSGKGMAIINSYSGTNVNNGQNAHPTPQITSQTPTQALPSLTQPPAPPANQTQPLLFPHPVIQQPIAQPVPIQPTLLQPAYNPHTNPPQIPPQMFAIPPEMQVHHRPDTRKPPKQQVPRKRIAIEEIIDKEYGGRPDYRQVVQEENAYPGLNSEGVDIMGKPFFTKGKKKKTSTRRIQGMLGKERISSLTKYLWDLTITLPFPEYLQDCASARSELKRFTSLESTGKRRKKRKALPVGSPMVVTERSQLESLQARVSETPDNWGSFIIPGKISDLDRRSEYTTIRVCIDAGSEAELITPSMVERLQLDTIPMSRTPWPKLTLKTSVGTLQPLLGLASGYITVEGVEVAFYACIIDPKYAEQTDYDILLGIPWLASVKAVQSVREAKIQITCPRSGKIATVKGPDFRPVDFKRLFLEIGGNLANLHERELLVEEIWGQDDSGDSEDSEDDEDDSSEDSEDDDEEEEEEDPRAVATNPPNTPIRRSWVNPTPPRVTPSSTVQCRGAILKIDSPGNCRDEVRYIEVSNYLRLYGTTGPYSFLAQRMADLPEHQRIGPHGEAFLIIDHDGRSMGKDGKQRDFPKSERTQN
ncbi:MAG: hypothetical protein JWM47_4206, partial [Acidimicrobiales bacterium]|nr:hypothetical protein [Acidimicrobiales bacterium]